MEQKVEIFISKDIILDKEYIENSRKVYAFFKRAQDIFFSLLALIVLFPLLLLVSVIVVIDSPGASPIFVQKRIGKNGKPFKMYKFRTMCPNAEDKLKDLLDKNEMDGPVFKIKDDPRITRFGKLLRKTNIDELPQLINVIRGDMSIIGPRPALPKEVDQYTDYERQRLFVRPGLSCYWQIVPHRNSIKFDEWMRLDLKYISERSFLVDWKIIFLSVVTCIKSSGL